MYIFKTALLVGMFLLVSTNDQTKPRGKRQQITYYPRRGGRPPPYAVQMEPIVQYSQRDPLYNPSASPKIDDRSYHDDPTFFNHYSNEPEPIIEIIIKESNETLPTPRPPTVPQPKPTKEPIQVFYVKYEKKKEHGDSQPRVIYDPPIPALNPVEEHEEIQTGTADEHDEGNSHLYTTEAPAPEPSTTLRAIIRPESEVYHSGSSGIRVTFGTEQIPPNNHSKRSDSVVHSTKSSPAQTSSVTPLPPPGSPKRQHGPYHNIQSFPRIPPAFPQQRIVNSFSSQQQLPPNYPVPHQQFQSQPNGPIHPPRPQQQRPPITIQNLPEIQQRLPFQAYTPPHRISINHPQQPGFPPALSISHQSVHLQNQPPSLVSAGNFNGNIQQHPHQQQQFQQQHHHLQQQQQQQQQQQPQQQQQQHIQSYKDQELEKQRYHQEQRRQQELRYREQQRLQEQQRQQEQQKQQDHHRKLEDQRISEQQKQTDQQRQQERQRQEEQLRIQEQQKFHLEQQRRKQEQDNRLLHEQQSRQQLKFGSLQPTLNSGYNQQLQQPVQQQRPGGEILKAVPKLEQHYAIRENPLHPGPFPPNPQVQPIQYPESEPNQFPQLAASPSPDVQQQQQQYFVRNPTNNIVGDSSQQQQQQIRQLQNQHNSMAKHQTYQSNQQSFFAQNLPTPQQQRIVSSPQKSIWGRPVFQENDKQKIYATPISNSNDLGISSTARTIYLSSTTSEPVSTTTTPATTTTEAPTTAAPKDEAKIKANIANLPDEVPDDIREQLLSSGILGNADIQILDYDKVGGIPIENLPPEALANFYGAGGAAATAASEPIPAIAKRPKTVGNSASTQHPKKATFTKVEHATLRPGGVEMKVVHFDPNTAQGQAIADQHIREDATHLKPVTIGTRTDPQYNRYLPLKVSGTSFPIPDAPELQGRKISSVVVLAPVDYSGFQDGEQNEHEDSRQSRMLVGAQPVKFLAGDSLKQLVKKPSAENYKKWLEQESRTEPQRQSVVLLVTTPQDDSHGDKEIFMYDVSSQSVSKLAGDLSSAFVNAAESNSDSSDTIDDSAFTTY